MTFVTASWDTQAVDRPKSWQEMISELKETAAQGIWVPEFGVLEPDSIDQSKRYHGKLYRLQPETIKLLADIVGFNARFDMPGIRTCYLDMFKTEGALVFEVERNIKPGDVSVRYMRDRWAVQEVSGRGNEGMRPWIKSAYRARFIPDKVFSSVAEQLFVRPDEISRFFIRINLKERIFGLIAEEKYSESFPAGAFSAFALPSSTFNAVEVVDGDVPPPFPESRPTANYEDMTVQEDLTTSGIVAEQANETTNEAPQQSVAVAEPPAQEPAQVETPEAAVQQAAPAPSQPVDDKTPLIVESIGSIGNSDINSTPAQAPEFKWTEVPNKPKLAPAAQSTVAETPAVSTALTETPAKPKQQVAQPQVAQRQKQQEQQLEQQNAIDFRAKPSYTPTPHVIEANPKYATYSMSEIDAMLKLQAENIGAALGSKIASQQRTFQEAVTSQEKTFSKLSDNFITQFESARVKLESTAKSTQETTLTELDSFKKQLNKELEQYRTQINKMVIPVTKALEEKPVKAKEKPVQEKPSGKVTVVADKTATKLGIASLVLLMATMLLSFMTWAKVTEVESLKTEVQEMSKKLDKLVDSGVHP